MSPLLLDTCAAIWVSEGAPIAASARQTLRQARNTTTTIYVSPITAWEVGMLVSLGRLTSPMEPRAWFRRLLGLPAVALAALSTDMLIASSFLPGTPPRDPADRILATTAREFRFTLMTRDRPLLDYGEQGHLDAVAC